MLHPPVSKSAILPQGKPRRSAGLLPFAFTACCLLLWAVGGIARADSGGTPVATIVALSGNPLVRHNGAARTAALAVRQSLSTGDVVQTAANGKLSILFDDGSQVRLGPHTSLQITAPVSVKGKTSFFKVLAGEIWARLRPGRAAQTQYSNLIVRGTEIDLSVADDGTTKLSVIEGEVEFFNNLGNVLVEESQQSTIRPGSAPTKPVTIANPGLIIEWTLDLNRALLPREKFYVSLDRREVTAELARRETAVRTKSSAVAHLQLGDALFDAHRYNDALAQYTVAGGMAPADRMISVRKGYVFLEQGRLLDAEISFNDALGLATVGAPAPVVVKVGAPGEIPTAKQAQALIPARLQATGWSPDNGQSLLRTVTTDSVTSDAAINDTVADGVVTSGVVADDAMVWDATASNATLHTIAAAAGVPNDVVGAAYTGLAWVALQRNEPDAAATDAQAALEVDGGSGEAHLALALAYMRQAGREDEAKAELQKAMSAQPVALRYQAEAWLALLALAQDDTVAAARAATAAANAEPDSALAQAALATVAFYTGRTDEAIRAARRAAALNPDSVATLLALGQAELADGDTAGAARAAARAAALDPELPEAFYLLGIADAQQRDYSHAARELKTALQLAPDYLAAASALARVYVKMGRPGEATALLTGLQARHTGSSTLLAALGETLYAQGKYDEALAQYRAAIQAAPGSAQAYAGLARLALDANHLNEAINAGQKAVELAPEVGAYHSILGLAYSYSRLDAQAEREFRTALALDPQNALALVQLGFRDQEGDLRTAARTQNLSFAQGFLIDPAISHDLLRGGINTEATVLGNGKEFGATLTHREVTANGKVNIFGRATHVGFDGDRPNADQHTITARQDTTYIANKRTSVYFHLLHRRDRSGVPGTQTNPSTDDRDLLTASEGILAARYQIGKKSSLWAGLFGSRQRDLRTSPGADLSFTYPVPAGFFTSASILSENNRSQNIEPELRFDMTLNRQKAQGAPTIQPGTLTLGLAHPQTRVSTVEDLFSPNPLAPQPDTGQRILTQRIPVTLAYAQLTGNIGKRGSFVTQLRQQRLNQKVIQQGQFTLGKTIVPFGAQLSTSQSPVMPSLLINYRIAPNVLARLTSSRRITDVTSSIFAPVSTLLTTESQILPLGLPAINGDLHTNELDIERYMGNGGLIKVFAFRTTARNLIYDASRFMNPNDYNNTGFTTPNGLNLDKVKRSGIGVRYEQPISKRLWGQTALVVNRTTASSMLFDPITFINVPAPFNGRTAPYHPKVVGGINLNYVAPHGNKFSVGVIYTGSTFQDTLDPNLVVRPRSKATTTVNLRMAREPSVHNEVFIEVVNLFDQSQFAFNDVPIQGRSVVLGATRRF